MNKIKGNKQEKVAVLTVSLHTQDRVEGLFFFFFRCLSACVFPDVVASPIP